MFRHFVHCVGAIVFSSCSHQESISDELERRGFTESRIVAVDVEKKLHFAPPQRNEFVSEILPLLENAAPERSVCFEGGDKATVVFLLTGSTFKSQVLTIKVNSNGDGELTIGRGKRRQFFSPALSKVIAEHLGS